MKAQKLPLTAALLVECLETIDGVCVAAANDRNILMFRTTNGRRLLCVFKVADDKIDMTAIVGTTCAADRWEEAARACSEWNAQHPEVRMTVDSDPDECWLSGDCHVLTSGGIAREALTSLLRGFVLSAVEGDAWFGERFDDATE